MAIILISFTVLCYLVSWHFFLWAFKSGLVKYQNLVTTRVVRIVVLLSAPFWLFVIVIYGIYTTLRAKG